jgi:hypothetical protein
VGGSVPEGGGAATNDMPVKRKTSAKKGYGATKEFAYFIKPDGEIVDVHPDDTHATTLRKYPEKFGFTAEDTKDVNAFTLEETLFTKNLIRIKGYTGSDGDELAIDLPGKLDIGKLQDMYNSGALPQLPDNATIVIGWRDNGYHELEAGTIGEFLMASGVKKHPGGYYIFKNSKLFQLGGPGSGFHGHRGRPGEVGGSSKRGNTVPGKLDDWADRREKQREDLELAKEKQAWREAEESFHRKRAIETAKALGFPEEKLETTTADGYLFTVGGQQFRAGADYDPETGQIRIFDVDEMDDLKMKGILAHEIQHDRWAKYHDAYQTQFIEVQRSIRATDDKSKWLIRADGSLRNVEDRDRLWAYDIHEEFISYQSPGWKMLKSRDGVSEYSRAYWEQASSTGSGFDYDRAVDETLAEIARFEANYPKRYKKDIAPVWLDLYKRVKSKTRVKKNQLFIFGGAGSGHHGHSGEE